jgi:hypothetical protein
LVIDSMNPKSVIRDLLEAEFASDFRFVRRIPSTETWKTLACVDALDPGQRDTLFDVLAERTGCGFQPGADFERQRELVRHPVYQRFVAERAQAYPWKYADPRYLRGVLDIRRQYQATQAAPLPPSDFGAIPLVEVESAEPPTTVRAPEIRREVKRALADRFNARPAKWGGGVWIYPGEYDGRPFTLSLDYGGNFHKLRYGISPGHVDRPTIGMTWEGMLGLGTGHWDFVCEHNLAPSVTLLGDIAERIVLFCEQVVRARPA